MENILDELEQKLNGKTVILGIGNPIRGDDAFGSVLVKNIEGKVWLKVYDGGSSPENLLGKIIKEDPPVVLIVDTVDFGGRTGEMKLLNLEEVKTDVLFFTHNPSCRLIFDFLQEYIRAKFYLLAIQPRNISLGGKMSLEVEERLEELSGWFLKKYPLNTNRHELHTNLHE